MIPPVHRSDKGLLPVLAVSLFFHAALYALFTWLNVFPSAALTDAPVYYVDMVNLPVESPQQGSPAAQGNEPAPPQPVKPPPPEMKLPAQDAGKTKPSTRTVKPSTPASKVTDGSSKDFEERLAKLEGASEARHEAAAMEALRRRTSGIGKGQAGIPGGTGTEAGSDYAGYIRSRLIDAFKTTIAYQDKAPRMVIVLTIDRNGRIIRKRTENSTGDRLFEDSVNRAIVKAEKEFRPPPGGGTFEYGFIFTAQGVGKN